MSRHLRFHGFAHRLMPYRNSAQRYSRRLSFERLEMRRMMAAFDVLVFSKTAGFRH